MGWASWLASTAGRGSSPIGQGCAGSLGRYFYDKNTNFKTGSICKSKVWSLMRPGWVWHEFYPGFMCYLIALNRFALCLCLKRYRLVECISKIDGLTHTSIILSSYQPNLGHLLIQDIRLIDKCLITSQTSSINIQLLRFNCFPFWYLFASYSVIATVAKEHMPQSEYEKWHIKQSKSPRSLQCVQYKRKPKLVSWRKTRNVNIFVVFTGLHITAARFKKIN